MLSSSPALANVGTLGLFTNGVQTQTLDVLFDLAVFRTNRNVRF